MIGHTSLLFQNRMRFSSFGRRVVEMVAMGWRIRWALDLAFDRIRGGNDGRVEPEREMYVVRKSVVDTGVRSVGRQRRKVAMLRNEKVFKTRRV
jgi:hypothetical protein